MSQFELPSIDGKKPVIPRVRGLDVAGRRLWKLLWASNLLDMTRDIPLAEQAAHLADDIAEARQQVKDKGLLIEEPITTTRGAVVGTRYVVNGAAKAARDAGIELERILTGLGMSVTSAAKLARAQEEERI